MNLYMFVFVSMTTISYTSFAYAAEQHQFFMQPARSDAYNIHQSSAHSPYVRTHAHTPAYNAAILSQRYHPFDRPSNAWSVAIPLTFVSSSKPISNKLREQANAENKQSSSGNKTVDDLDGAFYKELNKLTSPYPDTVTDSEKMKNALLTIIKKNKPVANLSPISYNQQIYIMITALIEIGELETNCLQKKMIHARELASKCIFRSEVVQGRMTVEKALASIKTLASNDTFKSEMVKHNYYLPRLIKNISEHMKNPMHNWVGLSTSAIKTLKMRSFISEKAKMRAKELRKLRATEKQEEKRTRNKPLSSSSSSSSRKTDAQTIEPYKQFYPESPFDILVKVAEQEREALLAEQEETKNQETRQRNKI